MKKSFVILALTSSTMHSFAANFSTYLKVKFDGDKKIVSNIDYNLSSPFDLTCGNTLYTLGSNLTLDGLPVTGPYNEDQRNECKVQNGDNPDKADKAYWMLNDLIITYKKNDKEFKCYINEQVGMGWDRMSARHDKIEAQYGTTRSCGLDNPDTYKVNEGKSGNLTINIKPYDDNKNTQYVKVRFEDLENLGTISNVNYSLPGGLKCGGKLYTLGANLTLEGIPITGPYKEDQREECKVHDGYDPSKVDNTYWTAESVEITYKKNGKETSCHINEEIGFSYDHFTISRDKLQAQYTDIRSCNNDTNDTYKIKEGSGAISGEIIIKVNNK